MNTVGGCWGALGSDMSLLSSVGKKSILHKPSRPLETETKEIRFIENTKRIFSQNIPGIFDWT